MSDTPRTNDAQFGTGRVSVDFARQLERELTAAQAENTRLHADVIDLWGRIKEKLEAVDAAQAEIARLKAGGCARDQRTTQFCAEALKLQERIETLENEKMELQKQRQQIGYNAFENALSLVNHRDQLQEENARLHHLLTKAEIAIAFANREPGVIRMMGDDYTLVLQEIRSKLKAKDTQ